jgi:hypothetical protein
MLAMVMVAVSCAPAIRVRSDFNKQANLSSYHTFSIRDGNSSGNPVMDQRIKADVEAALQSRGLEEVSNAEGDLIVVPHVATRTHRTYETFYNGWGWHWRWGAPEIVVNEFRVGTIVVDAFDSHTKTAMWHGYASSVISDKPEKNAERADEAVTKLFAEFPIQPKAVSGSFQ